LSLDEWVNLEILARLSQD